MSTYSWQPGDIADAIVNRQLKARSTVRSAIAVWLSALADRELERSGRSHLAGMAGQAIYAWPSATLPPGVISPSGRDVLEVHVDPARVVSADFRQLLPFLAPSGISLLRVRLRDHGCDMRLVEEELPFLSDPRYPMLIGAGEAALGDTSSGTLNALMDVTRDEVHRYAASMSLGLSDSALLAPDQMELLVPIDSIQSATYLSRDDGR